MQGGAGERSRRSKGCCSNGSRPQGEGAGAASERPGGTAAGRHPGRCAAPWTRRRCLRKVCDTDRAPGRRNVLCPATAASCGGEKAHPAGVVPPPVTWNGPSIGAVAFSATVALCSHAEAGAPAPEPQAGRRCQRQGGLARSMHCCVGSPVQAVPTPISGVPLALLTGRPAGQSTTTAWGRAAHVAVYCDPDERFQ